MENSEIQCAQISRIDADNTIVVQWEGGINDAEVEAISNDLRNGFFANAIVGDWFMIKSVRNNDSSKAIKAIVDVTKTREPIYSEGERAKFWSQIK